MINITGQYPGASAETVADTVVTPIEQQVNGVEGMLYISSNSTSDGRFSIAVTFELGTNLDIAQVQVQNRVAIAQPRLPSDVRNIGVTVAKSSPDILLLVNMISPDNSRDAIYLSNYINTQIKDELTRVDGVGSITVFGARDYAMQIWLDPDRLQSLNLTAADVINALQGQNVQVASGVLNAPPIDKQLAFQVAVRTLGRLSEPAEFANIVIKQTADAVVRLRDVARVELTGQDYSSNSYLDRNVAVAHGGVPAAGIQRAQHGRQHPHADEPDVARIFQPASSTDHLRSDPVHPAVRERGDRDHPRGDRRWSCSS